VDYAENAKLVEALGALTDPNKGDQQTQRKGKNRKTS